jgi:hypothetical protein
VKPLLVFAAVLLALAVPAAQDSQPLFRAGVDLITVDVAAVDSRAGRSAI